MSKLVPAALVALAAALVLLLIVPSAEASHFRAGTVSWAPTGVPREVQITGTVSMRYTFFNPAPAVGQLVTPSNPASWNWGDGSTPTTFAVRITSIDTRNDVATGVMVTTGNTPLRHTFPANNNAGNPWVLRYDSGARMSAPNHINNGNLSWRLETLVDLAAPTNSAPISQLPPLVVCAQSSNCTFRVPAVDSQGNSLSYRLSAPSEAANNLTWFPVTGPGGALTVQPTTGEVRWNTTGARTSAVGGTFYSTQVMVEDGRTKTPIDFLIQLIAPGAAVPTFTSPTPCDQQLHVFEASTLSFTVRGMSPNASRTVTVNHLGLPTGASFPLPAPANVAQGVFSWTPSSAQIGSYLVTFTIMDNLGDSGIFCSVQIVVDPAGAPLAAFTYAPAAPVFGQSIQFTDQSTTQSGVITSWSWQFGDGGVSTTRHPTHAYAEPGTYPVQLTVTNSAGLTGRLQRLVVVNATPPAAPLDLVGVPGVRQVSLSWAEPAFDGGSAVMGYVVYRDADEIATTPAASLAFVDDTLANGESHEYRVAAVNAVGEGGLSAPVTVAAFDVPSAPLDLAAVLAQDVELSWSAPASDGGTPVFEYWVFRDGLAFASTDGNTSFVDAEARDGASSHAYTVRARNAAGESADSAVASVRLYAPPVTTLSVSGLLVNGWHTDPNGDVVTATLTCVPDDGDACVGTTYSLDGAPEDAGTLIELEDGVHTLTWSSVAVNGGAEALRTATIQVDSTLPALDAQIGCANEASDASGARWCAPGDDGGIAYSFSASDVTSGLDAFACDVDGASAPCDGVVTTPGAHVLRASATDAAGNTRALQVERALDAAAPEIALGFACATPGASGWCRGGLTYDVTASDPAPASGIASLECVLDLAAAPCSGAVGADGAHTLDATARDLVLHEASAGASATLDATAPELAAHDDVAAVADAHGGASVAYDAPAASDATSGLASLACAPASGAFFALGSTEVACTATDVAGNEATSSFLVVVTPGPLARIAIAGPTTVAAGSDATYDLAGFDAYDNDVALAQATLAWTAPPSAGPASVEYTESGVTGTLDVTVVAGALDRIVVEGPTTLVAGTSATYALSGFDAYDNPVALAQGTLDATAPTSVGTFVVAYEEGGIQGTLDVSVVPDALARIDVAGPATMVAGTTAPFELAGFDQYDNAVALAQASLDFTAPTSVGVAQVEYSEQGVTGSALVDVVADALARIDVSGPASLVAGTAGTFEARGFDQYGNDVPLAQPTFDVTAPTSVGLYEAAHEEQGVVGAAAYEVVADALHHIRVTGPATLVAGQSAEYGLEGFDQYENVVPLAQSTLVYEAPTAVGSYEVTYTESGVTGSAPVDVVAASLASIVADGPASLVAGTSAEYALAGYDAYGNAVPLAQASLAYTAPTLVGSYVVSYTESGVTGEAPVEVVADALARIVIEGPTTLVAGTSATYALSGFDQYGNAVPLSQESIEFTAPTAAGQASVTFTEGDVTAALLVDVIADALHHIVVDGPTTLVAGTSGTYALSGFDQYENTVPLAQTSLEFTAPTSVGTVRVTYAENGVEGALDVDVVHDALAAIDVDGPTTVVAGSSATYALAGSDQYGNMVPLAQSELAWTAPTSAGPTTVSYTEEGVTGSLDVDVVADALARIAIDGPLSVWTQYTETYALAGFDQFDNAVPLAQSELDWTAPTQPGTYAVTYEEQGVEGSLDVEAVLPPVDHIVITSPTNVTNVGRAVGLTAVAYDVNGLSIPAAPIAWSTTLGTVDASGLFRSPLVGNATISASSGGVSASTLIRVSPILKVEIVLDGGGLTFSASRVSGVVKVRYEDGAPVVGATGNVTLDGNSPGRLLTEEAHGTTNARGEFRFTLITSVTTAGEHTVRAKFAWPGNAGEDTETVVFDPAASLPSL